MKGICTMRKVNGIEIMTNKEKFETIRTIIENSANLTDGEKIEFVDFINSRIEMIDKKGKTISKTELKKIEETENLKTLVYNALVEIDKPIKVSDLIKTVKPLNDMTTQKVTAILSKLIVDNKVEKIVCKRETLYSAIVE